MTKFRLHIISTLTTFHKTLSRIEQSLPLTISARIRLNIFFFYIYIHKVQIHGNILFRCQLFCDATWTSSVFTYRSSHATCGARVIRTPLHRSGFVRFNSSRTGFGFSNPSELQPFGHEDVEDQDAEVTRPTNGSGRGREGTLVGHPSGTTFNISSTEFQPKILLACFTLNGPSLQNWVFLFLRNTIGNFSNLWVFYLKQFDVMCVL